MYKITIADDFDLGKIADCGQCFRAMPIGEDGMWRFVSGDRFLYIRQAGISEYEISCNLDEWQAVWHPYFDLERSYSGIRRRELGRHPAIDAAMECGRGIRILRQNPWEMLVTFIISQRKSIPAIRKAVESIAEKYGGAIEGQGEIVYSFPTAQELAAITPDELRECGLGYRAPYVYDAVQKILSGEIDLKDLESKDDQILFDTLTGIHGVGKKVANCVMLFGYGRVSRAPVDVWIARAIDGEFGGRNIFDEMESDAGIIQQYVFYYERYGKKGDS